MMQRNPQALSGASTDLPKLAYRIDEAVSVSGLARTALFEAIARGELRSFRAGKRRLVLAESLRDLVYRLATHEAA